MIILTVACPVDVPSFIKFRLQKTEPKVRSGNGGGLAGVLETGGRGATALPHFC